LLKIAHDPHLQWTTACEFLDDDTFICSEDGGNLITCYKNSSSTKEEERNILNESGLYHLGEHINVFQHGKSNQLFSYLTKKNNLFLFRLSCYTTNS
jgi:hypothetical protein